MANEAIRRLAFALVLFSSPGFTGCVVKHKPPQSSSELITAQSLITRARELGAATRAPKVLARAETLLEDANKERNATRRHCLARLAMAEGAHALSVTELKGELEDLSEETARIKKQYNDELEAAVREHRKLEDRIDVLLRDLELTETEIIRIQPRLKGSETRAEASSAVAEARILLHRANRERCSASAIARCQELLARAEGLLQAGDYSLAAFFAHKARGLLRSAPRTTPSRSEHERPSPSAKP
jgi:hypothetical protein